MSDVTRDEFDRMVERVTRVEQTLAGKLNALDALAAGPSRKLDALAADQGRKLDALLAHVDIDPPA